jgi:hypothetical protein
MPEDDRTRLKEVVWSLETLGSISELMDMTRAEVLTPA